MKFSYYFPIATLVLASFLSAFAQKSRQTKGGPPVVTFHATSRMVLVDVVVRDRDGKPVDGLKRSDFEVSEDGKRQRIQSFEEHSPALETARGNESLALGPNEYANYLPSKPTAPLTVLFFDDLNTSTIDQMNIRNQFFELVKALPKDVPLAVFVLNNENVTEVQGISGNSEMLKKAAASLNPHNQQIANPRDIILSDDGDPVLAAAVQSMGAQIDAGLTYIRQSLTFQAMHEIADSIAGYPGRKNLIWVATTFPKITESADSATLRLVMRLINQMASEQISIYPVHAGGLVAPMAFGRSSSLTDQIPTAAEIVTMHQIASDTGGAAFNDSNFISVAIRRCVDHGSSYYTLGYVPTDLNYNGKFRHLKVKLRHKQHDSLAYRDGYWGVPDTSHLQSTAAVAQDKLMSYMQRNMPETTGLAMRVKLIEPTDFRKPIDLEYTIPTDDLTLVSAEGGGAHVTLDFLAVAWDEHGKQQAALSQTLDTGMTREMLLRVKQTGIHVRQELALVPGKYQIYAGVLDRNSGKIGTISAQVKVGP